MVIKKLMLLSCSVASVFPQEKKKIILCCKMYQTYKVIKVYMYKLYIVVVFLLPASS